jgi:ribosomal protein S18 acetylase RimI-like enzyme
MLEYRNATREDFEMIAAFPQNEEELFFMFPKGKYPLNAETLAEVAAGRYCPTVVTRSDEILAYGNLYEVNRGEDCWIGNVIVSPYNRRSGAGSFLIQSLIRRASEEFLVKKIQLVCHNTNTKALLFYYKLGFKPFDMKDMEDYKQELLAGIKMKLEI